VEGEEQRRGIFDGDVKVDTWKKPSSVATSERWIFRITGKGPIFTQPVRSGRPAANVLCAVSSGHTLILSLGENSLHGSSDLKQDRIDSHAFPSDS